MNIESLANELLLDIFEYLSIGDLLRVFHHLNLRFNVLLSQHFQQHGLDFYWISKHIFDIICQEYLPLIIDRITSICSSESIGTPQQIDHFLATGLTFLQFTHLRSLTFYDFDIPEKINKIMFV
jgi:hypothetical protein